MIQRKLFYTMNTLDEINAAILAVGADVLSMMDPDEIAQVVRMQSVKLKLRVKMLDYTSHLNETGEVREGQRETVENYFEDLQMLLGFYKKMGNQTEEGGTLFGQKEDLMEPIE